jgi:hypothetical protein
MPQLKVSEKSVGMECPTMTTTIDLPSQKWVVLIFIMPMRDERPNPFWGPPDQPKRRGWTWVLAVLICTAVAVTASRFL